MPFQDFARQAAPGVGGLLGAGLGALGGGGLGFVFGGGPAGALGGGIAGAQLGNQFGQGLGGLLGNLIPQTKTPFQEQAEKAQLNLIQQLQQQNPFQRVEFDPIRQQELQRFQQQTLPGIAEHFAGTGNIQSSAFHKALSGAGSDLGSRLAALQAQHDVGQQGAQLSAQGQDLSRLGQLGGFLQGDQRIAAVQEAARQQQIGNLYGLGQQAAGAQINRGQELSDKLQEYLKQSSQQGLGEGAKIPPGFLQVLFENAPQLLALLG